MRSLPPAALHAESPEVYYSEAPLPLADDAIVAFLKERAAETPRKRCRLCTHRGATDAFHEMLIVHSHDTYVRPHRHLRREESLTVLEGTASLVIFDDRGSIERTVTLGERGSGKAFYYRMPAARWHTLVIDSEWFVFLESTTGPFNPEGSENASWAPDGIDAHLANAWLEGLRSRLPVVS
ncbi:MAG: WbuC family cupin fold metalloprotein [Candidatus Eremiobacteraeota bacterium]|nr:WbuC family cupin fold metalloprotein [Candidatus Eremiobacteraeota bacterium]